MAKRRPKKLTTKEALDKALAHGAPTHFILSSSLESGGLEKCRPVRGQAEVARAFAESRAFCDAFRNANPKLLNYHHSIDWILQLPDVPVPPRVFPAEFVIGQRRPTKKAPFSRFLPFWQESDDRNALSPRFWHHWIATGAFRALIEKYQPDAAVFVPLTIKFKDETVADYSWMVRRVRPDWHILLTGGDLDSPYVGDMIVLGPVHWAAVGDFYHLASLQFLKDLLTIMPPRLFFDQVFIKPVLPR